MLSAKQTSGTRGSSLPLDKTSYCGMENGCYICDQLFCEGMDANAALVKSVQLARKCGVPESQILHSVEEIDEFFTK